MTKKDFVDGSIVAIKDDITVVCTVYLDGVEKQEKTMDINLQRGLFPKDIFIGMPFRLRLVDDGKLTKPVVTKRKPYKTEEMLWEEKELEKLIEDL